jgi:flagellar protein FliT
MHNGKAQLSADALQRKVACLKTILSNDKEIMDLLQPWMLRLSDIMSGSEGHRK